MRDVVINGCVVINRSFAEPRIKEGMVIFGWPDNPALPIFELFGEPD